MGMLRRNAGHILSTQIVGSVQPGVIIMVKTERHLATPAHAAQHRNAVSCSQQLFAHLKSFIDYKAEKWPCTAVRVGWPIPPRRAAGAGMPRNKRRSCALFV